MAVPVAIAISVAVVIMANTAARMIVIMRTGPIAVVVIIMTVVIAACFGQHVCTQTPASKDVCIIAILAEHQVIVGPAFLVPAPRFAASLIPLSNQQTTEQDHTRPPARDHDSTHH